MILYEVKRAEPDQRLRFKRRARPGLQLFYFLLGVAVGALLIWVCFYDGT